SQAPGFRNDVLRHGQFADIVQQSGGVESFEFCPFNPQFFGDLDGVDPHPLQVFVGGLVFSFDSERQGLNGSKVQVRHFFNVAFFVFQFPQIQPVGAVDQINSRNEQQRSFPVECVIEPGDCSGNSGPDQVVRE